MDISQLESEVERLWEISQAKREEAAAANSLWHEAYRRLQEAKREQLVEQMVAERVDEAVSIELAKRLAQ